MNIVLKHISTEEGIVFEKPAPQFMQKLKELFEKCDRKYNGYVSLKIEPPYKPRTTGEGSQNNKFWSLVTLIANEVGDDSEKMIDTENGIKDRAITRGYPYHINKLNGKIVPYSTTKVNTVEMSYLIETALQICAELDITVPTYEIEPLEHEASAVSLAREVLN